MAAVVGNKIIKDIGTTPSIVVSASSFTRYTLIGLSITNVTDGFVYVDVLINDGYYLKDTLLPSNTSLRAISTGEKLILGYNDSLSIRCSVDNGVDVVCSYASIVSQTATELDSLIEGDGISILRENNNIIFGLNLNEIYFKLAADDSTIISVPLSESIKFIGGTNITTSSDAQGNITIDSALDLNNLSDVLINTATDGQVLTYNNGSWINRNFGLNLNEIYFKLAADDSTIVSVPLSESIKFIGGTNITTSSDAQGNITIDAGLDLNNLSDVLINTATDGQVLTYNNGSWINQTISADGGDLNPIVAAIALG